jgi:hypothetical protein
MKDYSSDKFASSSKKFLDEIISSYYECNPKDNKSTFEKRPKCFYCEINDAIWENSMLKEYCCNDCVPRGCSCRLFQVKKRKKFLIDNYSYQRDEFGNELPCEDWHIF